MQYSVTFMAANGPHEREVLSRHATVEQAFEAFRIETTRRAGMIGVQEQYEAHGILRRAGVLFSLHLIGRGTYYVESPAATMSADGHPFFEGDRMFSHYTMTTGLVRRVADDGWFNFDGDDGKTSILNGERVAKFQPAWTRSKVR